MVTDAGTTPQGKGAQFGVLGLDSDRYGFADTLFTVLNDGLQRREGRERFVNPDDISMAITAAIAGTVYIETDRLIGQHFEGIVFQADGAAFFKAAFDNTDCFPRLSALLHGVRS